MAKAGFDPRAITDPKQIEALASSVRHELVDTLAALGGRATVAELADQLGRHADGLYYHLRVLVGAGLVREAGEADAAEREFALAGNAAGPLRLQYRTGDKGNLPAVSRYVDGLLKVAKSDFIRALGMTGIKLSGKRRQLWAARNKGWVSDADLEEVNQLLERLCELTSQTRQPDRTRLVSLSFALSPAARQGRRRTVG